MSSSIVIGVVLTLLLLILGLGGGWWFYMRRRRLRGAAGERGGQGVFGEGDEEGQWEQGLGPRESRRILRRQSSFFDAGPPPEDEGLLSGPVRGNNQTHQRSASVPVVHEHGRSGSASDVLVFGSSFPNTTGNIRRPSTPHLEISIPDSPRLPPSTAFRRDTDTDTDTAPIPNEYFAARDRERTKVPRAVIAHPATTSQSSRHRSVTPLLGGGARSPPIVAGVVRGPRPPSKRGSSTRSTGKPVPEDDGLEHLPPFILPGSSTAQHHQHSGEPSFPLTPVEPDGEGSGGLSSFLSHYFHSSASVPPLPKEHHRFPTAIDEDDEHPDAPPHTASSTTSNLSRLLSFYLAPSSRTSKSSVPMSAVSREEDGDHETLVHKQQKHASKSTTRSTRTRFISNASAKSVATPSSARGALLDAAGWLWPKVPSAASAGAGDWYDDDELFDAGAEADLEKLKGAGTGKVA